jgi:hypothetical protein
MTIEERQAILRRVYDEVLDVTDGKGRAYAGDDDALDNFKKIAELLGISPFIVWAVFFLKHVLCVTNAIKRSPYNPVDTTESIHGRVVDIAAYDGILDAMTQAVVRDPEDK